jgi:GAF domain-containing protein
MTFARFLKRLFAPPAGATVGGILVLRERVLTVIVSAVAALGAIAYVEAMVQAVEQMQWVWAALYTLAYLWLLIIAILRSLPFLLRAGSLLFILYGLGTAVLLQSGLSGDGRVLLLAFAILGGLLLGAQGGLVSLALSLASYGIVGWLMTTGRIPLPPLATMANSGSGSQWISGGAVLLALGATTAVSVGFFLRDLEATLGRQRDVLARMKEEQSKLEQEITQRTKSLERQRLQIQTAAEIAKIATEAPEPEELFSRAVDLIRERFSYYHASVFTLDSTSTWAELVASTGEAGQQLLARHHHLAVGSASIIGWVTANKKPRVTLDVEMDPFHFRNPLLPETRSEMAVPLMVGDRLIGALDVQSTEPRAFGEADVRALEAIAAELAIAHDNARLLRETSKRLRRIENLGKGSGAGFWERLSGAVGLEPVHLGSPPGSEEIAPPLSKTALESIRQGQTVVAPDGREVAAPVRVRGEVVATITARKPSEAADWSPDDLAVLDAIAAQTALALENIRQYSDEQRRLAELEVVNRISQAASQLVNPDSLYRVVHNQIDQILGDTDLALVLYDREPDLISMPYVSTAGEVSKRDPSPLGDDLPALVIRNRQPLLLTEDVAGQLASLGVKPSGPVARSWLGVPMLAGEEVLGAIILQDWEREQRYTDDDAALLTTIASQVATAVQNARLLDQVRRTARRQRLIHEITAKVRRSSEVDSILATATRELSMALNAGRSVASLEVAAPEGPEMPASSPAGKESKDVPRVGRARKANR